MRELNPNYMCMNSEEFTQEQAQRMYQALKKLLAVKANNSFRGLKRLMEALLEAKYVVRWVEQDI